MKRPVEIMQIVCAGCGQAILANQHWKLDEVERKTYHPKCAPRTVPATSPEPMTIYCPACQTLHIDEGEWATRPHKTHQCQACKLEWRPFPYPTVGVGPTSPESANDDSLECQRTTTEPGGEPAHDKAARQWQEFADRTLDDVKYLREENADLRRRVAQLEEAMREIANRTPTGGSCL